MDNKKELKRYIVDRAFYEHEDFVPVVYKIWRRLLNKEIDKIFVDAVFQYNHYKFPYPDIYDAYLFCQIETRLIMGELLYFRIPLGQVPVGNSQVAINQKSLNEGLKDSSIDGIELKAVVAPEKGRGARKDGQLRWEKELIGEAKDGTIYEVAPDYIPLEIGTTDSITTYQHIVRDGGVARWAYDSKELVLFINLRCEVIQVKKLKSKEGLVCVDE